MITIMAAVDNNNVIGVNGMLPWHSPPDLARFRSITAGHTVVMGRETFESIGRLPLRGRYNLVLTRHPTICDPVRGAEYVEDLDSIILDERFSSGGEDLFVIGGSSVYETAMQSDRVSALEMTHMDFTADVKHEVKVRYFPKIDSAIWRVVSSQKHGRVMNFIRYERK